MSEKIRVDICHDHFARLFANDVCATCPSKCENESVIKAMSQALEADEKEKTRAFLTEIQSLRRQASDSNKRVELLEHKVLGNGQDGLAKRMTVLETKTEVSSNAYTTLIPIAVSVVSAIAAMIALVMR